ncbi:unnamed protein product [Adineta ricciae]|uniref:Uncharacterized protein n=1 Tax=Adineta ricciae TaxID=249248 RepID=A0A815MIE2_ADIRI|nr:unnamed protein product [Adineta ricciae]
MIGIPVNPNSVYIPIVQTGCLKFEFDSTYPVHLNGIISQGEYNESIQRINRSISSTRLLWLISLIFIITMIVGVILFIVGGVTATHYYPYRFPPMIAIGMALTVLGSFIFGIGCCSIQFRRLNKMRRAVADESRKYSSHSQTPCSWRLDTTTTYTGYYGNQHRHQVTYHIVIDIGRSVDPNSVVYFHNQVAPDPTTVFSGPNTYAPPPYSGQPNSYCPQCNTLRRDLTGRFCSSCGYSFHKY